MSRRDLSIIPETLDQSDAAFSVDPFSDAAEQIVALVPGRFSSSSDLKVTQQQITDAIRETYGYEPDEYGEPVLNLK